MGNTSNNNINRPCGTTDLMLLYNYDNIWKKKKIFALRAYCVEAESHHFWWDSASKMRL